jgi:hypothetical protein
MNVTDPIRQVSVVSTGQVQICPGLLGVNLAPDLCVADLLAELDRTPAHQRVCDLIMVGDVTYDAHLLEVGHVPGVGNRRRLREATAMINKMRQQYPGLVILPAHDPGAADRLAQATGQAPTLASA